MTKADAKHNVVDGKKITLNWQDLGVCDYPSAFAKQEAMVQQVMSGGEPTVFLVEHPAVITVTPRKDAAGHVLLNEEALAARGIALCETNRGGDVTYHGPGQLVVYPIVPMRAFGLNLSSYMRTLEQAVIETLAVWQIEGLRECGNTGVWVPEGAGVADEAGVAGKLGMAGSARKICAMGVRIRKGITMHGLALNVAPDMTHFNTIVPCGLADRGVVSMQELLGETCPTMDEVKSVMREKLEDCLQNTSNGKDEKTTNCDLQ